MCARMDTASITPEVVVATITYTTSNMPDTNNEIVTAGDVRSMNDG